LFVEKKLFLGEPLWLSGKVTELDKLNLTKLTKLKKIQCHTQEDEGGSSGREAISQWM
jgi:hypothetical protein